LREVVGAGNRVNKGEYMGIFEKATPVVIIATGDRAKSEPF
jgi:hypothetical protein